MKLYWFSSRHFIFRYSKMLVYYILAVIFVVAVNGLPDGAPLDACDTMTPIHATDTPQPSASPFAVTVSPNSVAAGGVVSVMLMGMNNEPFQGFLLKALPKGVTTGVAGQFTMTMLPNKLGAMPCKYLDCSGVPQSALTHVDATNKTMLMGDWSTTVAGTYNIFASIAADYDIFWVKVSSEDITVT